MTAPFDDPGMATERTTLAWNRAAIALAAAGVLLIRLALLATVVPVVPVGLAVGGGDVLLAAAVWLRADPRRRRRQPLLRAVSYATVATAVAAIVLAVLD